MRFYIIILFLTLGTLYTAKAQMPDTLKHDQTDSAYRKKDSINSRRFVPKVTKMKVYHPDSTHSPHKAVMRSLYIPGWGQVYNHRWWKVPLIYAGLASFTYYYMVNQKDYHDYLAIARFQESGLAASDPAYDNDPRKNLYITYGGFPKQAVINVKDGARRNRDLCVLGILGTWGINIIDAYIDAKFQHSYSMDNNFGVKVSAGTISEPVYASNFNTFAPALKLTFILK